MKIRITRVTVVFAFLFFLSGCSTAQELESIKLNPPDLERGLPFMEAVSVKASATDWSEEDLSLQDLSDLLWAANGLNRPEENKTTASSAGNSHDTDIYVFNEDGAYVYDFANHELDPVLVGDHRPELMMGPPPRSERAPGEDQENEPDAAPPPPRPAPSSPPIQIILVSDADRFGMGTPELKAEWGAIGAGIISQNISLFCAATGIKTRPRASMDKENIKELLNLKDSQHVLLNHPVGYAR